MTEPASDTNALRPLLSLRGIGKTYASPVLQAVDLDLMPGEVHVLMGANGAGKSTLAKIISGLTPATTGEMRLNGESYLPANKARAEARGVQIVQQELTLIPTLSIAENLFLNELPSYLGMVRGGRLREQAIQAMRALQLDDLDPSTRVNRLGVGQQQLVEISRALHRSCRVLILDEPTAALTSPQVEALFRQIERLRAEGAAIVYVSHRLDEVRRIADRITVLRDGKLVATRPAKELGLDEAVRLMVGANPQEVVNHATRPVGPEILRVDRLRRGPLVKDVSLTLHRGEVLGISGLVGAGRTELLRAIFGADRAEAGAIYLKGNHRPVRFRSPRQAVRAGLGMVSEDRKAEGLMLPLSVRINMSLGKIARLVGLPGWISRRKEAVAASTMADRLKLKCHSLDQPVGQLSGGNQQKVVMGRWLLNEPEILLLDEPTRGIDVGAKFAIYQLIEELAASGKGLMVVSSEVEELMLICDRIAVISAGRLVRTFRRGEWSQESLLAAAFEGYTGNQATDTEAA